MAVHSPLDDPLLALRHCITTNTPPTLHTSDNPLLPDEPQLQIAQATHIRFSATLNSRPDQRYYEFTTPTRFYTTAEQPINLRSIYFTWLNKDASLPDYIAAVKKLNEELQAPGGAGGNVVNLAFAQKVELIAWLGGESNESEFIKPLENNVAGDSAAGVSGAGATQAGVAPGRGGTQVDPRLLEIYQGERKMGDHNTALRGTKAIDFSQYRKTAATFLRSRPTPSAPQPTSNPHNPALVSNLKKPARRLEPIILLSPSASSLLRMSNVKSFLDEGLFVPPNATDAQAPNLLHLTRVIPSIDRDRPLRFILVDSTQNFKPDYWNRVVAVFTTGQPWQFKSYKYQNPAELFSKIPGIFVGWQGEEPPDVVRNWGRGVLAVKVDKWSPVQGPTARWRDREVVERIWGLIEENMKAKGWGRDGPGMAG